jgi:hypothetical protein
MQKYSYVALHDRETENRNKDDQLLYDERTQSFRIDGVIHGSLTWHHDKSTGSRLSFLVQIMAYRYTRTLLLSVQGT